MGTKILLLLLLCCGSLAAQNKYVIIETIFGEKVVCQFSESPKLVHNNDIITITTTRSQIVYKTSEISKVYVNDSSSGVENTFIENNIRFEDNCLYMQGFIAGETVNFFDMAGHTIASKKVSENGTLFIPLNSITKDFFIIKTKNHSIKVTRK